MDKKVGIEKIKAILSMGSMALLSIQHFVGLFADNVSVSYLPLAITFFTIFIGTLGEESTKAIKWVALFGTIIIVLPGCILYTIQTYSINIPENVYTAYIKIIFCIIGVLALVLSIMFIKRIRELE